MDSIGSLHPLARTWLLDGPLSPYVDAFVALMRPIGLAEVSRTGAVAIARGPKGIME